MAVCTGGNWRLFDVLREDIDTDPCIRSSGQAACSCSIKDLGTYLCFEPPAWVTSTATDGDNHTTTVTMAIDIQCVHVINDIGDTSFSLSHPRVALTDLLYFSDMTGLTEVILQMYISRKQYTTYDDDVTMYR